MRLLTLLLLLPIALFSQDLTLTISDFITPSCSGASDGTIILLAEGGQTPYVYSIGGGAAQASNIFDDLAAGDYQFSVTDSDGTIIFVSGTLEEGLNLSLSINDVDPSCKDAADGQLMISEVNGASDVTFEISGPIETSNTTGIFMDLPIGTYTIIASTPAECLVVISTILSSEIDCPQGLSISIFNQILPSCNGVSNGTIQLLASGGESPYTYGIVGSTEQSNNTFEGLEAGNYEFYVTDNEGTTVIISTTLENEINLSINFSAVDPSCKEATDGMLTISEVIGESHVIYEINGPASGSNLSGEFSNLPLGTYVISVTASMQLHCSEVVSTTLSSDEDCPENPNLCPLLQNRIGMQIDMVAEDEYSLRMLYKDEIDVINNVNYTALHEIIHYHLLHRQMNVSLKVDFQFMTYCSDIEGMRNETNDSALSTDIVNSNTQSEIDLIRDFVLKVEKGESLKI